MAATHGGSRRGGRRARAGQRASRQVSMGARGLLRHAGQQRASSLSSRCCMWMGGAGGRAGGQADIGVGVMSWRACSARRAGISLDPILGLEPVHGLNVLSHRILLAHPLLAVPGAPLGTPLRVKDARARWEGKDAGGGEQQLQSVIRVMCRGGGEQQ